MKFLIDEDLSPKVAQYLCKNYLIDAVAVRDRGLLGKDDRTVLNYAFNEDRILITANIVDFERFATLIEVHSGIVFLQEGDLLREEQITVVSKAVKTIEAEIKAGREMINRVLYISITGTRMFQDLP